jgi:hypothetical protein
MSATTDAHARRASIFNAIAAHCDDSEIVYPSTDYRLSRLDVILETLDQRKRLLEVGVENGREAEAHAEQMLIVLGAEVVIWLEAIQIARSRR